MSRDPWRAADRWLSSRLDEAPAELAQSVRELVREARAASEAERTSPDSVADVLVAASLAGLDRVVRNRPPGANDRASALRLLAADAALTYAFEAAADEGREGGLSLALRTGVAGSLGERLAAIRGTPSAEHGGVAP